MSSVKSVNMTGMTGMTTLTTHSTRPTRAPRFAQDAQHMLFERINASGVGLTIGSIGSTTVNNITFRDAYMHNTFKGIYMKFADTNDPGSISNVTYENIVIDNPEQWAIWIGPAQQSDSSRPCAAHPCSLCWPQWSAAKCYAPPLGTYENILLRNITVNNPSNSPGVLLGNETNPMINVTFEDVVVNNPGDKPWGDDGYYCENIEGVATGKTWPGERKKGPTACIHSNDTPNPHPPYSTPPRPDPTHPNPPQPTPSSMLNTVPPCFDDQTDATLAARLA